MNLLAILISAAVFSGCGNQYITGYPIPDETMTKIETVVDAILTDTLSQHGDLVKDVARSISEDVFVDGASAILGWRFKEGKNVVKMFPEEFTMDDLLDYNASSYEDKMELYLIPGAKKCYEMVVKAAQGGRGDL